MRAVFAVFVVLAAILVPQLAFAAFDDSRAWFERMSPDERTDTQADLILLGHYDRLVDGEFGRSTFDAIVAFQRSQGRPDTGVLTPPERDSLSQLATRIDGDWGMQLVRDEAGHVAMIMPTALLTERQPTAEGTNFASRDGELSLETMHADLAGRSFADLYDELVAPQEDRTVTYRKLDHDRFVVSGRIGDYNFYTTFLDGPAEAVGYSMAWGHGYDSQGRIAALYLASYFAPIDEVPPEDGDDTTAATSADFVLPADRPDVIALNADITGGTPDAFDAALRQRPDARIVVLNSPGGGVDAALIMAREIHDRGMNTYVPPGMGCYSACAYMFFAGAGRQADGELGVHQIYTEDNDLVVAQTTLGDVLDALQDYGVSQKVISHMLRTPPEDMYVFTRDELNGFGISAGPPIKLAISMDAPSRAAEQSADPVGTLAAFVELSSQTGAAEAQRSLAYLEGRWGSLFEGAHAEVAETPSTGLGTIYRIRVPAASRERADAICTAIHTQGGGCYVSTD